MGKLLPVLIVLVAVWASLSLASVSADMPYEEKFNGTALDSPIIDQKVCTDSSELYQNNTTDNTENECNDYMDFSTVEWSNLFYGGFVLVGLAASITIIGFGVRTLLWMIWLIGRIL